MYKNNYYYINNLCIRIYKSQRSQKSTINQMSCISLCPDDVIGSDKIHYAILAKITLISTHVWFLSLSLGTSTSTLLPQHLLGVSFINDVSILQYDRI